VCISFFKKWHRNSEFKGYDLYPNSFGSEQPLSRFSLMAVEGMYSRLQGKWQFVQTNQLVWNLLLLLLLLLLLREKADFET